MISFVVKVPGFSSNKGFVVVVDLIAVWVIKIKLKLSKLTAILSFATCTFFVHLFYFQLHVANNFY